MIPARAVATISAAILAYEVLLVRLFAIVQWHHFAFMAISVAMLGFGVSGALLTVLRERAGRSAGPLFVAAATAFAVTAPGMFFLAQRVPFNALEVVWQPSQLLYLGLIYVLLVVPFTVGAACIGLAFIRAGTAAGRVYLWNMVGSAVGALGVVALLAVLHPLVCLAVTGAIGFVAAALGTTRRRMVAAPAGVAVAAAVAWAVVPSDWTSLHVSQHKGLTRALAVQDARPVAELSGPQALLTVVESPSVPFRHAPGLSITAPALPPPQLGIFADGEFAGAIDLWDGSIESLAYLDYSTDALVYHLTESPDVLVLGAGGGRRVLQALGHDASRIDAVEGNADMLRLLGETFAEEAGDPLGRPEVEPHHADARRFLEAADRRWDAILLPPGEGGAGLGARGLSEDFLHTVETFRLIYRHLTDGGWLSATTAIDLPPRATLRLVATMRAALERAGVASPADHLLVLRGMSTATMLMKRGAVTEQEIATARDFAAERGLDFVHYPGMEAEEANRRNILASPIYFTAVEALLGPEAEEFIDAYKFDIAPATDESPYFADFFKWATLPELIALGPAAGAALLDLAELIVVATLAQALVLGLLLVVGPLATRGYRGKSRAATLSYGAYFTALGLAFLMVEIAWIQKFVLFLGHPVYAVAVVLAGFLVFAGIGAGLSARLEHLLGGRIGALPVALGAIAVLALGYLVVLPPVLSALPALAMPLRFAVALALIAPLALFMGMPFPLGLARVAREDPDFVPWAWGLNGCASVVSAAAATLLMMEWGFSAAVILAVAIYLAGGAAFLATPREPVRQPGTA